MISQVFILDTLSVLNVYRRSHWSIHWWSYLYHRSNHWCCRLYHQSTESSRWWCYLYHKSTYRSSYFHHQYTHWGICWSHRCSRRGLIDVIVNKKKFSKRGSNSRFQNKARPIKINKVRTRSLRPTENLESFKISRETTTQNVRLRTSSIKIKHILSV